MTPRGSLIYLIGLVVLFGGLGLVGLFVLFALLEQPRQLSAAIFFLLLSILFVFAAGHLLAAGLYQMLVHLYRAVSRTDPAGDRPLKGTRIFLLGQIASAMAIPMSAMFLFLPDANLNVPRNDRGLIVLLAGLPCLCFVIVSLLTFFSGLGIMVRDIFIRQRDIVDKREAERRRRLDEADEPQTEVIPTVLPAELRAHVKEDR
jgi:hypothetical protein